MRRRTRRRSPRTSDERRFVGVGAGAAAAVATLALGLLLTPSGTLSAPGPLGLAHATAAVPCESCHQSGRPVSAGCVGCHGPHPSRRPGHRALASSGSLECSSCHAVHGAERGLRFTASEVVHFGPGTERLVVAPASRPAGGPVHVPLLAAERCQTCHGTSPRDPASHCFTRGVNLCFDEHATPGDAPRDAHRAAAAALVTTGALPPVAAPPGGPLAPWTAAALALGALAWALARRRWLPPPMPEPAPALPPAGEARRLPFVNPSTCLGCHACVDACPYDVLEVHRFTAVVARPDACCGLTLCEQRCPNGSLVVRDVGAEPEGIAVTDRLESRDVPGLFLAGDLTGLPLIRSAVEQGARAVRAVAEDLAVLPRSSPGVLDLVVVGAGPAGLAAGLEALRLQLRCEVIEQGSVAQSLRNFPRGKVVLDRDLDAGDDLRLPLETCTKEELLARWQRAVRRAGLSVREGMRLASLRAEAGGFVLEVEREGAGAVLRARRVILALGRRGSPRKLAVPIPEAAEGQVHYHLADARSFARRSVLVVGLGDAALEALQALAAQPGTRVEAAYRGAGFTRGRRKNVQAVERLVRVGRVAVRFESEVTRVEAPEAPGGQLGVTLRGPHGVTTLRPDALFVLVGSRPAWDLLEGVGVRRRGHGELPRAPGVRGRAIAPFPGASRTESEES